MTYLVLEDFRSGLDTRRQALTAPAGTLRVLKNAHISAGGEIEKRMAFGLVGPLLAGSFGLAGLGTKIYVFKSGNGARQVVNTFAVTMTPITVEVMYVQMPVGKVVSRLEDWDVFDGKIYAVIQAKDGTFHHFYDGDYVNYDETYAPNGLGRNVRTFKSKMYGIIGKTLFFSAVDNPRNWKPAPVDGTANGAGFINLSNEDAESAELIGLEIYYNQLAIMSRFTTQLWEVDPDPKLNNLRQTLRSAGTVAPRSLRQYGSGDILYLNDSGIRSLRAKDSSNAAAVSDIGSPIDPEIQKLIQFALPDYVFRAFSLVEPVSGRFWVCFEDKIYVLSYFPGPKVSAWSEYIPDVPLEDGVVIGSRIFIRSGDNLYVYGGMDGTLHNSCKVEVETPYLNGGKPATVKPFYGIDLAAWGTWKVSASYDPNKPLSRDPVCIIMEPTYVGGTVGMNGVSTHLSLTLTNEAPGPAILGNITIHFKSTDTAD
jgi:hypothetical protein